MQRKQKQLAVKKRLDAGEDFAKVAKEKGTDRTKDAGGDLGFVEYNDTQMDQNFYGSSSKAQSRKISAPVQTQFGCHIIKTIAKERVSC